MFLCLRQSQPNLNYLQDTGFSAKYSDSIALLYTAEDHLHSLFTYEGSSSDGSKREELPRAQLSGNMGTTEGQQQLCYKLPDVSPSAYEFLKLLKERDIHSFGSLVSSV